MTATAAVLSAIYDRYDTLKPVLPQNGMDVEWVLVTDDEALYRGDADPLGWQIVYEPHPGLHPNRAAKHPKMLPVDYTAAEQSVWVDASFAVVSPTFVADVLGHADPLAQFVHPWRGCLHDEAFASAPIPKYVGEPIAEQAAAYRRAGHPLEWGLWATGVIARQHTPEVVAWGKAWLAEVERWSFQDQISHPFVCRLHNLRPVPLPGTHLGNAWLAYQGSGRH
ncbi:DUF616 domain-containing protein [Micromonospora sp. CPCC 205371]|nr:DUF616 domain-containing protein [Micromonospora sp. CPCC 205371]